MTIPHGPSLTSHTWQRYYAAILVIHAYLVLCILRLRWIKKEGNASHSKIPGQVRGQVHLKRG